MRIEGTLEEELNLKTDLKINGKPYRNIIIREVLGFDEEEVSKTRYKDNPTLLLIELIYRVIAEVKGTTELPTREDIKNLPVGILDELILDIRKLSVGEEIEIHAVCPNKKCKTRYEDIVSIDEINRREGNYDPIDLVLPRGLAIDGKLCKNIKLRFPDGNIQERFIQKSNKDLERFGILNTEMIHACIMNLDGYSLSLKQVSSMTRKDRQFISNSLHNAPGPDTKITIECRGCEEEIYTYTINALDFLV